MFKLCGMFHCTPSQLDQEDAEVIRLAGILARGTKEPKGAPEG